MSAPQIPNLNTLRKGGIKSRGRGQNREFNEIVKPSINQDDIIRSTDNDAAASRLSAVEAGYLQDPFAKLLSTNQNTSKRLPLMNRGTYVRTKGIDRIVDIFLSSKPKTKKQIISLGAGSDTRYFRIKQENHNIDLVYHEIDFESNTKGKITRIRSASFIDIAQRLCNIDVSSEFEILQNGLKLASSNYCIHPQDLRHLSTSLNIDVNLPTLLISECCLIYLPPPAADAVLQHFNNLFPFSTPLAVVIYEPIRPHDSFGKRMVSNLVTRGIHLQTLEKYADPIQQTQRLSKLFTDAQSFGSDAADIDFIWQEWIDEKEKERVDRLEWMDEVEEFVLLAKHYCIAWGWRGFEDNVWHTIPTPKIQI